MALSTERASGSRPSSSAESSAPPGMYDVFLSFRGVDTRRTIASSINHELQKRDIKTFMDDTGLETGKQISPSLLIAIKESWSAIVVLSPNYASSSWCLHELAMIIECMEDKNMIVLPIFYGVDPSDVRHQKTSFGEALTSHEERFGVEAVNRWRAALTKVANLSGLESKKYGSDQELVENIVETVCSKVRPINIEWAMCTGDFVAFEATKRAMDKIMRALQHDEVTTIGVFGMGGVGKTSMVNHVGAQARKIGLFNRVIMAVVSQTPNLRNIQGTLADLLGLKLQEETNVGRATRIVAEILRGYKILIILDDIWERMELSSIGIPNHTELQKRGSKIIFTTRRLNVCHTMENQASVPLRVLSEDDAWDLFVKKARKSFDESPNFYDVARTVAKECAGLPVALVAVARALGDKDLYDWREAARRLKAAQPANYEDEREVFRCIKLSYDYLKPDDDNIAKSFFLLCCLFPEDFDIEVEDLLMYAIGKGIFHDAHTIQEARAKAHSVVNYLKASSLLLDGAYPGFVKMHDVIRDVAISISLLEDGPRFLVKAGCELRDWPAINIAHEGYSAISLMRNEIHELPKTLVCSKLQILLLQSNSINEIPNPFFQSPNELRVLDLSETSISCLPSSSSLLTNLLALYLDECKRIVDISILGKLKNLQILSMKNLQILSMKNLDIINTGGTRQKALPKEIGRLTKLKLLDVTDSCFETVPSAVISNLNGLEELYMKCDFCDWGSIIVEDSSLFSSVFGPAKNASFDELTGLSRLNSLKVHISDVKCLPRKVRFDPNWVNFDICISRKEFMRQSYYGRFFERKLTVKSDPRQHLFRYVTLNTSTESLPDWFIEVVTEKAEILEYIGYSGLDDILVEYDHGRLHVLKCLAVIECHMYGELMKSGRRVLNKPVFESLEELYLEGVRGLRWLCVAELPPGSLCNLKLLNVRNCLALEGALLRSNLLQRLQNLEILHCENTEESRETKLESVFDFGGIVDADLPKFFLLPKLREITLCHLMNLRSICIDYPFGFFSNLNILAIRGCHQLRYLFEYNVALSLFQLELLWVEECSNLRTVIERSGGEIYLREKFSHRPQTMLPRSI
ncbi:probable disease resistance protein At4g27220 [Rosa rugosa]|uniref:probable disease resistance protein At4g27220 n=1 Tax=Rosa rugosa TaxID=74645 RepID=UPI002B412D96|nr:probable disease resistance protein At4g27220 [Rosa rugosa]XP_062017316.1 probable disease resistance protein At4g27220 [Rosa rugosa]